ncbi:MAG: pilus assembly protein TadE [Actinobacteria bacterium HGW-Actinobacteria-2]|nr:MAG: pilus assembly protein TadE [Actinobacteria bacterium HGW-Actinobacteria-2]
MPNRRSERGAEAVEFALLVPLLMLLLLGIMEFALAFVAQASLAGAARLGVRNYVINYDSPGAEANAIALATAATPVPANVASAAFSNPCAPSKTTTLTITYRYQTMTGIFDGILGGQITVTGVGSMQCGG